MKISEKYQALLAIRSDAQKMIKALQNECSHEGYTARYDKTDGDYGTDYAAHYWVELKCAECGWRKTVDHDEDDNRLYYTSHPRVYDECSKIHSV